MDMKLLIYMFVYRTHTTTSSAYIHMYISEDMVPRSDAYIYNIRMHFWSCVSTHVAHVCLGLSCWQTIRWTTASLFLVCQSQILIEASFSSNLDMPRYDCIHNNKNNINYTLCACCMCLSE